MSDPQAYFKQPVFQVLAEELWHRYWLKEDFGSSIGISLFKGTDHEPLRSFLGITTLVWDKKKRITTAELEKALSESILHWHLEDLVVFATRKPLVLKKEQEQAEAEALKQFKLDVGAIDARFSALLTERQLKEWSKKGKKALKTFEQVARALQKLPVNDFVRLPFFAYEVTGNPHAFDETTDGGQLLQQMLTSLSNQTAESLAEIEKTEQRHGLLAEFHLLKDDIMNYAAIRGVTALNADQTENQMWRQACNEEISWNVPLKEILRMSVIRPYLGDKILVVENSGVYSILLELLPQVPILCSSGQFTFAVWQLLRKLAISGTKIYYSGDLDPEGLGMAQKLKTTFGDQLQFIGMNLKNFHMAKTNVTLSNSRLKKLQHLNDETLITLGELIQLERKVAYQEGFIEEILRDVKCEFTKENR